MPVDAAYQGAYAGTDYNNNLATNRIQLSDKMIEPDKEIETNRINRNTQMGNIQREDISILEHKFRIATLLREFPMQEGGFLFHRIAGVLDNELNWRFVASNSIDGFGRLSSSTNIIKQELKEIKQQGNLANFFRPVRPSQ